MGMQIGVLALIPPRVFSRLMGELRLRYPEARITALVGTDELRNPVSAGAADDYLVWRSFGTRALISELRRRRFDLLVVAHGRDYYARATYWKALALALASGARGKLFCPDGQLGARAVPRGSLAAVLRSVWAVVSAAARGLARTFAAPVITLCVAAAGLVLVPIFLGIAVADLVAALAGDRGRPGRSRARPRQT